MNEYLINALKEGRAKKGMKQSEVASLLGVKGGTLSNYENGISEPDIDTFATLCEIYELDFVTIMEEAYGIKVIGHDFEIKPSEIKHIKKYRALDRHGKEMVDFTLQKEWERSTTVRTEDNIIPMQVNESSEYISNAAHLRTDIEIPEEVDTAENDIMDDSKF